jgi:undecaprenyl-diphosphatase
MPPLNKSIAERIFFANQWWIRNLLVHSEDSIFLFPLLLVLFLLTDSGLKQLFGVTLVTIALTGILVWVIKKWVRKARPKGDFGSLYRKYDPYSFPSGHAARTFAIVTIVAGFGYVLPALLLLGWSSWVSFVRLHLALHHWPDILAGIFTGFTVGILVLIGLPCLYPVNS